MCGIAALFRIADRDGDGVAVLRRMRELVAHRGPDGRGEQLLAWDASGALAPCDASSRSWRVGLAHRRLAILDLSPAAAQPMRYGAQLWTVYNGELYNHVELRAELRALGYRFATTSDTEVLLAAYDAWGEGCFARLRGMWGVVIVDGRRGVAVLSRDRLGIKPLYHASVVGALAVVSELKQLTALPTMRLRADAEALSDYLTTGYEESTRTFFEGVRPVPAGTFLTLDLRTGALSRPVSYWHPERVRPSIRRLDEASTALGRVMEEAVHQHLRADVPVGFALSGGLDSSALAAWVRRDGSASAAGLHAFSAVFPGHALNEAAFVDAAVGHLGLTPHAVEPTAAGLQGDLDRFVWAHDEPVGSLSQYAGYAVARLTRSAGVPVTLNGQGGDEVLAGYWQSYFLYLRGLWRARRVGGLLAGVFGALAPGGNPALWGQVPFVLRRFRHRWRGSRAGVAGRAAQKLQAVLAMSDEERRVYEVRELYLPRLLKWDDRNFMAFSVEGRYPFLDHEVIETVLSFAPALLYRRGWVKEPLRRAVADLLPASIVRRRSKVGFETPQTDWLRGGLRSLVDDFVAGDSPLWAYVERRAARGLADQVGGARGGEESAQALMRYFMADRWLRRFTP